ncbi:MAG TPA: aspartate carbamoyltransferase catalytic subunit [Blastocatellia bacterium]|nr:aspartate carbamoyltransferase catalytic subunit [Blastocatellia bacterium]
MTLRSDPADQSASLHRKDLLGIRELSVEEIQLILDTASTFKDVSEREIKKVPTLRGRTVINLFFEASTRTRTSFEIAAKRLSADAINISASTSSVVKGETLIDTAQNLQAMRPDVIVIRHSSSGAPHTIAKHVDASVVNAGDGAHEHPTQALLDAYTIIERKGGLSGLRIAIIGDILHSRVARSNIHLLTKMGAHVVLAGPRSLLPVEIEQLSQGEGSVTVAPCVEDAITDSDVVMMLRIQLERQNEAFFPSLREYSIHFGLNKRRLALAKGDAIVLHPGPVNRGIELASDVMDDTTSVILNQVTNGVAVRMAILYLLAGGSHSE